MQLSAGCGLGPHCLVRRQGPGVTMLLPDSRDKTIIQFLRRFLCDLSGCYDWITTLISPSIFRPGWSLRSPRCFVIISILWRRGRVMFGDDCLISDPEQSPCHSWSQWYSQLAVNVLWPSAMCLWCNPVSQLVIHSLPCSYVNCSQDILIVHADTRLTRDKFLK